MWKFILGIAAILGVAIAGFSLIDSASGDDLGANAVIAAPSTNLEDFARADGPRDWDFPRDHGAHLSFQTEWWYYTGNLATADGRRFGYQFTVFRRAIAPRDAQTVSASPASSSEWRADQVYLAHFTVSDIADERFYHDERYSRGGAGLAGGLPNDDQPDERYHVYLEDWSVMALDDAHTRYAIRAVSPGGFAVDLALSRSKPPAFQGDAGLSAKSAELGNASYYYSLSRLATEGTITLGGEQFAIAGDTWMDHEFSTSAMGGDALGWDWFGLHFDDGRELMVGQIRLIDGGREPAFGGLLIERDGSTRYLPAESFTIEATGEWRSPHTDALYPAGWTITISADALAAESDLTFTATPLQADQELHSGDIAYWEGAVALAGDVTGYGYAELTGYATTMTGRF
jgi:predicted secreted hydrolase